MKESVSNHTTDQDIKEGLIKIIVLFFPIMNHVIAHSTLNSKDSYPEQCRQP